MDVKQFGMKNLNRGRLLNDKMQKTMEKLASGMRINRAGDDAAGLAVSEKLRIEMSEQQQSVQNVRHGANLARTADAALQEVNDMMKRAEKLCLQAANGTYSELERQELTDELNALYDEMERIFSSAQFNDIKLFQYETPEDVGDFPCNMKEYIEHVQELTPEGTYEAWGTLDIMNDIEKFALSEAAKGATATLQLQSGLNLNDAGDLDGKNFYIKPNGSGNGAYITFSEKGSSGTSFSKHSDGKYYYGFDISTEGLTVQQVMDKVCATLKSHTGVAETIVPENAVVNNKGEVTFTFGTRDLPGNYGYPITDGDGTLSNGVVIFSNQETVLKPVDEAVNQVQQPPGTLTAEFWQDKELDALTDTEKAALKDALLYNSIRLDYSNSKIIKLSELLTKHNLDAETVTATQLKTAIVSEINSNKDSWKLQASLVDGDIVVTRTDGSNSIIYINELRGTAQTHQSNQQSQCIENTSTKEATTERGEEFTFSLNNKKLPLTLEINGTEYTFYNGNDYPGMSLLDTTDMVNTTEGSLLSSIASKITSAFGSDKVSCKAENGMIKVTSLLANKDVGFIDHIVIGGVTELAFGRSGMGLKSDFEQKCQVEMTVPADVKELEGRGFSLGSTVFEFTTDNDTVTDGQIVKIGDCNDLEAVKEKLAEKLPSGYTVKVDGNKLVIERNSAFTFSDGKLGATALFTKSVEASGGKTATKPSATIDFSSYNSENFDELYGKGFRVTCATCDGEFINVVFCNDKDQAEFPESFLLRDAQGNVVQDQNGNDIEIRNCVVELKKMSNGADIVQSIVTQLTGVLDHYTEVSVGTPASVLVVQDKRVGNLKEGDKELRAEILSGVYTNCVYDLTVIEHTNPNAFIAGPDSGIDAHYGFCPIYAGDSEGKPEWIAVHLPNLTLQNLNLDPPRPDLTKEDTISDVIDRLKIADQVVSMARGQLGADQNRLDHAKMNLSVAAEQTADSYSRIRDLDVAEGMTEQVKLNILQQSQQSALAHINQQASEVLKLMQ